MTTECEENLMVETLATCWSHPGQATPYPTKDVSDLTLRERAVAAAEAGYEGIGIYLPDLRKALSTHTLHEIGAIHRDLGFRHIELEFLQGWWASGEERVLSDQVRRELLEAAEILGARHFKIGGLVSKTDGIPPPPLDLEVYAAALHQLGQEAAAHGTKVALEFITTSNVENATDAVELLQTADHPSLGLCVDTWHIERGTSTNQDVANIPEGMIIAVEITDGWRQVTGEGEFADMVNRRACPGEGEFDIAGFVAAVRASGFDGPWGIEVISAEQRQRPILDALTDFRQTSLPYLGSSPPPTGQC
jgi:sugar phosphate isomerase/epimerase